MLVIYQIYLRFVLFTNVIKSTFSNWHCFLYISYYISTSNIGILILIVSLLTYIIATLLEGYNVIVTRS